MWSEKEQAIAKQLAEPEIMAFLTKVFVKLQMSGGQDLKEVLKKNIAALDDDAYGRLMKVVYLTGEENKHRINLIKQVANPVKKKGEVATAPK